MPAMPSKVVALWVWYHGEPFYGYQSQPGYPTVQDTVMNALRKSGMSRNPVPAGRTDRGVHARMQVLSMRVVEPLTTAEIQDRLNAALPKDIGVAACVEAPPKFHAAWSAIGKTYRYRLGRALPAAWAGAAWETSCDPTLLERALALAVGTRDFASFCEPRAPVRIRTLHSATVGVAGDVLDIALEGDAFGRFMVRGLVGAAVEVARGALSIEAFTAALDGRLRGGVAPIRAPAHGLTLWEVHYQNGSHPFGLQPPRNPPPEVPPFLAVALPEVVNS
jgi:tRNA pseudouridine38-40 synthase